MVLSLSLCLLSLILTYLLVRNGKPSLGLPFAYLFLLFLIHVPGAIAHLADPSLPFHQPTIVGIRITAFGVLAFVAGLWISRSRKGGPPISWPPVKLEFQLYALLAGWLMTFSLRHILIGLPSINAVADTGSKIWILPIILAFALSFIQRKPGKLITWGVISIIFPVSMLIFGGFLCHGVDTVVMSASVLLLVVRSHLKIALSIALIWVVGISVFVTYFTVREDIRDVVWGGGTLEERVSESTRIITEFQLVDLENPEHTDALHQRLNQNFYVGLAAMRLDREIVDYYRGRTFWEGLISLIPRLIWPEKPVYGGSPRIINDMAGFHVNENSSFGVGNVMEFYINYGIPSLIIGFVFLGFILGSLDRIAATAYIEGNHKKLMLAFLPAISFIRPEESVVEMVGGAAAAWIAAFGFSMVWSNFIVQKTKSYQESLAALEEEGHGEAIETAERPGETDRPENGQPSEKMIAPKNAAWASRNPWFGNDNRMTERALELRYQLVNEEGFDPRTDRYFDELDRRIRIEFPDQFDKGRKNEPEELEEADIPKINLGYLLEEGERNPG